jgi:CMP-N,N'-diacetyllegionaminic acid synthase
MKLTSPKILCTICARAGSKGVKNKNIRDLQGKPLVAHTLEQALQAEITDCIAVSSDSPKVLEIAQQYQIPYPIARPEELATDTADKLAAIRHAVEEVERLRGSPFDLILDLDPTSPLREVQDIKAALNLFLQSDAENLITAAPARHSPYFNMVENNEAGYAVLSKPQATRVVRRQESPACYDMNASIYIWTRSCLFEKRRVFCERTVLYVMPEERSKDIDSELDFEIVNLLLQRKHGR